MNNIEAIAEATKNLMSHGQFGHGTQTQHPNKPREPISEIQSHESQLTIGIGKLTARLTKNAEGESAVDFIVSETDELLGSISGYIGTETLKLLVNHCDNG